MAATHCRRRASRIRTGAYPRGGFLTFRVRTAFKSSHFVASHGTR
jgi:hypothetical protein